MSQTPPVVDVRPLPPREKHPLIFNTFDSLAPGEHLLLVNDHDPMPLKYQFQFERPDQFEWRPIEQGPDEWRVEIAKK